MNQSQKKALAKERTDWAEERTILAVERTFSAWIRTGLSSLAIGLGFQAIFGDTDPTWAAKFGATLFIAIGIVIFFVAYRSATSRLAKLDAHELDPLGRKRLGAICSLCIIGSVVLDAILWLL